MVKNVCCGIGASVLGLDALPFSPAEVFDIMRKTAPNVARKWPEEAFSFKYILQRGIEKGESRKNGANSFLLFVGPRGEMTVKVVR